MNPHKIPFVGKFAKSVASLRREDPRGLLYHMDYTANYNTLELPLNLAAGGSCSTFVAPTVAGDTIMGRNFDLRHFRNNKETANEDMTGLIVAIHGMNPKAKYKSLCLADAYWLDAKSGRYFEGCFEDGKTDISMALFLPFICMDGMNEKGLAVSIMHLPTENRWDAADYIDPETLTPDQKRTAVILTEPGREPNRLCATVKSGSYAINTADKKAWTAYKDFAVHQTEKGKKTVLHPVLMRMMLDSCATVDEAIALAKTVNVKSVAKDADYHVLAADASGRAVMLEWVNNELKTAPCEHGTNFYVCREDHYGYGYERDGILAAAKAKYSKGMPESAAMRTLALASQNCIDGSDVGFTQWSAVYNLEKKTMKLCVHMDYDRVYEYHL